MSADSLDTLLVKLANGEDAAAERVFRDYEPFLRAMVRRRLTPVAPHQVRLDGRRPVGLGRRPGGLPRGGVAVHRPRPPAGVPRPGDVQPFLQPLPPPRPRARARAAAARRTSRPALPASRPAAAEPGRPGRRALGDDAGPLPAGPPRDAPAQAAGPRRWPRSRRGPGCTRGACAGSSTSWRGGWPPSGRESAAASRTRLLNPWRAIGDGHSPAEHGPRDDGRSPGTSPALRRACSQLRPGRARSPRSRSRRWWPPGGGASGRSAEDVPGPPPRARRRGGHPPDLRGVLPPTGGRDGGRPGRVRAAGSRDGGPSSRSSSTATG